MCVTMVHGTCISPHEANLYCVISFQIVYGIGKSFDTRPGSGVILIFVIILTVAYLEVDEGRQAIILF